MYQRTDAEVLSRASTLTPTVDLSTITSPPSIPVTNSLSGTNTMTMTNSVSTDTGSSGASSSSSLSTGAKIGIGIGVPIAVLLGLLLGFMIWRRRRTHGKSGAVYELEQEGISKDNHDNQVTSAYYANQPVHEIQSTDDRRHELDGTTAR
jgi:hypothetical protein